MTGIPVDVVFRDGALHPPSEFWAKRMAKEFNDGERYSVAEVHERSQATHNHYFAAIENAWQSLPPNMAERFPSSEHLRKFALCKAGYCTSESISCASPEEARKIAVFVRAADEFGVIRVDDCLVTRFVAKSQSYRTMDKAEFAASKEAVLRVIGDMLEIDQAGLGAAFR